MINAVEHAKHGTEQIKRSLTLVQSNCCLSQQFPVLTAIPTVPEFPSFGTIITTEQYQKSDTYCNNRETFSFHRNVVQFVQRCEEICYHQRNVIAAVAAQIKVDLTIKLKKDVTRKRLKSDKSQLFIDPICYTGTHKESLQSMHFTSKNNFQFSNYTEKGLLQPSSTNNNHCTV